ncbi:PfkB family carbohydrate kinase [Candidatus Nitrososphaera gargensis]|nr:PfkB family carbohydrate kinase [Candidatus Nitrososphaera gargensis]
MPSMLVCGAINWDTIVFVDELPKAGQEIHAREIISVPGGKGANTAVAAARILGAYQVQILGMLGLDDLAERHNAILKREGIDTSCLLRHKEAGSGQAYVIVDKKGENMILTYKAANQMIAPDVINNRMMQDAIKQVSTIVIIDPPLDVASALLEQGRQNDNKTLIWSPSLLTSHGLSALYEHMKLIDWITLNEQEARALTGSSTTAIDGMRACVMLSKKLGGGKRVVVTLGRKGCILCWNEKKALIPSLDLAQFGLKPVSSVGAGDTLLGALSAFKIKGFDDIESLFMANVAAALKTTKQETRGSPNYDEIKNMMDDKRVRTLFSQIVIEVQ